MSVRVLLIRHGRTAGNGHHYVGLEDLPLDEVGVIQARSVAERLAAEPIAAVYVSGLTRTVQTAMPLVAGRPCPLFVRPDLNEVDYGAYQGIAKSSRTFSLKREHRYRRMPGGESLHDVYLRARRFAAELRASAAGTVAVVGHYRSNQMLVAALGGLTFDEALDVPYRPENGSVYEVAEAGAPRLIHPV